MGRYLTVYGRCPEIEMRDDPVCSRKAADVIINRPRPPPPIMVFARPLRTRELLGLI